MEYWRIQTLPSSVYNCPVFSTCSCIVFLSTESPLKSRASRVTVEERLWNAVLIFHADGHGVVKRATLTIFILLGYCYDKGPASAHGSHGERLQPSYQEHDLRCSAGLCSGDSARTSEASSQKEEKCPHQVT